MHGVGCSLQYAGLQVCMRNRTSKDDSFPSVLPVLSHIQSVG